MIEKEFVPYEEALALKELGFNKPCLASYYHAGKRLDICEYINHGEYTVLAPTFSQAFRWVREKYWYTALILCDSFQIVMQLSTSKTLDSKTWEWKPIYITQTYHKEEGLKSYDESELACLKQLIEIAKEKNNEQQ
tara:strand:- start:15 stop:422 length:408 start_codon:yes stop_codon:yes gene_type:complete